MANRGRGTVEGRRLRRNRIARVAVEEGVASVARLAEEFGVSAMTIYRDVAALEDLGLVTLIKGDVHGSISSQSEASVDFRIGQNRQAKEAMAKVAADLVPAGSSIIVDDSTSCLYVLDELLDRGPCYVISNSLSVAKRVSANFESRLQVLGGEYESWADCLTGPPVHRAIQDLSVDFCFLSSSGISNGGCYHPYLSIASIKSEMLRVAETSVLLVDHTKFERRSVHKFADLADFDVVVTDSGTPVETQKVVGEFVSDLRVTGGDV